MSSGPLEAQLVAEWEGLSRRLRVAPFLAPGWLCAWRDAFSPSPLRVLTVRRSGELVGALAVISRRGVVRAPVNWHTPLFGAVAADEEAREALVERLLADTRVLADVSFVDEADPWLQTLRRVAANRDRSCLQRPVIESPYVQVRGRDWETYRASLGKHRKEAERLRRRLDEQGGVTVEFTNGGGRIEQLMHEGFELEGSGWKARKGTAILSDPPTTRFYSTVIHWARQRGELVLAFLRLDGRPLAFDLCLESGGSMYVLKGGIAPEYRRFAPGVLLTYESLRRAFEVGLESYELLGDADAYKLVWTAQMRRRYRVQVFSPNAAGQLTRIAWSYGRPALKALRARLQDAKGQAR